MDSGLNQSVSSGYHMSQKMQQSIKVLHMTSIELSEFLEAAMLSNPFLEIEYASSDPIDGNEEEHTEVSDKYSSGNADDVLSNTASGITLKEYLVDQVQSSIYDPKDKMIALYLTHSLDDNGYLTEDIETTCAVMGCSVSDIEAILNKLRYFDPTGCYSYDLVDCLAAQLEELGQLNDITKNLVSNLKLLANDEISKLARISGSSEKEVHEAITLIKDLNPKPGSNFISEISRYAIPDIFVTYNDSLDDFVVTLNQANIPDARLNKAYIEHCDKKTMSKKERDFYNENIKEAQWLLKAIKQRNEKMLGIVTAIVEVQYEFFKYGVNFLKPMVLADISKRLEISDSTVSRVGNKIVSTAVGVYEIKDFFSTAIDNSIYAEGVSNIVVKNKIKQIIGEEKYDAVLSDAKIASILEQQGISISRRTVAKYRDSMKIPTANRRKKAKQKKAV